jgi:hypothetical protein
MLSFKVNHLRQWLPLTVFHLIVVAVVVANFPRGQWLLGWDGLYPELNLPLNISRGLQAVWQEQYGVGVFGGHGFAATLPHSLLIGLLSLGLPAWALRPAFTFGCFYLGGLGFYFLARKLFKQASRRKPLETVQPFTEFLALIGALLYLFNLGTTQMFYIQLEAFIVQFAALPWLFWGIMTVFDKPTRKNWFVLLAIGVLGSIQGFIPQVFAVTLIGLAIFLIGLVISRPTGEKFKQGLLVLLVILAGNAYWLLPFGFYSLGRSQTFLTSYNNLISTPDFIAKSFQYGNLQNAALLKGFYWDGYQLGEYMFAPWWIHHDLALVPVLGYGFFGLAVLGLVFSWLLVRNRKITFLGIIVLVGFAGLAIDVWPISLATTWLYQHSDLFAQAFRTTFTKFSFLAGFGLAFFSMMGVAALLVGLRQLRAKLSVSSVVLSTLTVAILIYSLPSFQGHFFYRHLKVNLPGPYLESVAFLNREGEGRIADFPQGCPEGWSTLDWGYLGSGFLWYGIKQPLLNRSSDVWSNVNEAYFWEVRAALQAEDFERLDTVLEKYRVRWVLYDQNILHCRNLKALKHNQKWLEYLNQNTQYRKQATFSGDGAKSILVFERQPKSLVELATDLPNIGPVYSFVNQDQGYLEYGNYETDQGKDLQVYYPFRSLFSGRSGQALAGMVTDDRSTIFFSASLPEVTSGWAREVLPVDEAASASATPQVRLEDKRITVTVEKTGEPHYRSGEDKMLASQEAKDCSLVGEGVVDLEYRQEEGQQFWRLEAQGANSCLAKELSSPHGLSHLVKVTSRNIEGDDLLFSVTDQTTQELVLKAYLPDSSEFTSSYFLLPPQEEHGLGYSLRWESIARGRQKAVNDLEQVEVWPVPFEFLKRIKLVTGEVAPGQLKPGTFQKRATWFYQVTLSAGETTLIFNQGYHQDWKAFYVEGVKPVFLKQVLVNNWANGWELPRFTIQDLGFKNEKDQNIDESSIINHKSIYIVFWPQLLEFVGFGMLLGVVVWLIRSQNR